MKNVELKMTVTALLFLGTAASASTFVGNGGSSGDIELKVATNQIVESLRKIQKSLAEPPTPAKVRASRDDDDEDDRPPRKITERNLCECPESFKNHSMCNYVRDLDDQRRNYCDKFLRERGPELERIFARETAHVQWTNDEMSVRESEDARAVEGVANTQTGTITVNLPRFLDMTAYQRIFLLTHEHMHFVKEGAGYLQDEGAQGPFKGANGGREFINAVSASLAMAASETGAIERYRGTLSRSKGYKSVWFDGALIGISGSDSGSPYLLSRQEGLMLGAKYFFGNFGVGASVASVRGQKDILTTIHAEEQTNYLGVGVYYRFFPFSNPLSFWGQSHAVVGARALSVSGKYRLRDDFNDDTYTATASAFDINCSYYIPFKWGLWAFAQLNYLQGGREFKDVPAKYDNNSFALALGVSYGL